MFESRYSKLLTTILVVVIAAIIGLLGFLAYDCYQKYAITKNSSEYVDNFEGELTDDTSSGDTNSTSDGNELDNLEDSSTTTSTTKTYKGFGVLGTMSIPATNFKYPILEKVTKKSIETAVAFLYGAGINQPGNSVIVGHNYRNGLFFSNNKKLNLGDKIYITDTSGNKLTYTIYNKFETTPEDTSFYQRDTGGVAEITLSTCTDDSKARLIIFAKAE